jgi:hypothetical protein
LIEDELKLSRIEKLTPGHPEAGKKQYTHEQVSGRDFIRSPKLRLHRLSILGVKEFLEPTSR